MSRREKQEKARREYEANFGKPPPPPPEPPSKAAQNWSAVLGILMAAALTALFFWGRSCKKQGDWTRGAGSPRGSVVTGTHVVVIDLVTSREERDNDVDRIDENTRVIVFDAATGNELSRVLVPGLVGCRRTTTPTRLWCDVAGRLELYELPQVTRIISVPDAVKPLGAAVVRTWHIENGIAFQLLADGRAVTIDPASATPTRIDAVPEELKPDITGRREPATLSFSDTACDPRSLHGGGMGMTARGAKDRWHVPKPGGRTVVVRDKIRSPELIDPQVISETPPLVLHATSADAVSALLQISRLRDDGTLAWTTRLGASCENAAVLGGTYAVTRSTPRERALGIDSETGAVRWRSAAP